MESVNDQPLVSSNDDSIDFALRSTSTSAGSAKTRRSLLLWMQRQHQQRRRAASAHSGDGEDLNGAETSSQDETISEKRAEWLQCLAALHGTSAAAPSLSGLGAMIPAVLHDAIDNITSYEDAFWVSSSGFEAIQANELQNAREWMSWSSSQRQKWFLARLEYLHNHLESNENLLSLVQSALAINFVILVASANSSEALYTLRIHANVSELLYAATQFANAKELNMSGHELLCFFLSQGHSRLLSSISNATETSELFELLKPLNQICSALMLILNVTLLVTRDSSAESNDTAFQPRVREHRSSISKDFSKQSDQSIKDMAHKLYVNLLNNVVSKIHDGGGVIGYPMRRLLCLLETCFIIAYGDLQTMRWIKEELQQAAKLPTVKGNGSKMKISQWVKFENELAASYTTYLPLSDSQAPFGLYQCPWRLSSNYKEQQHLFQDNLGALPNSARDRILTCYHALHVPLTEALKIAAESDAIFSSKGAIISRNSDSDYDLCFPWRKLSTLQDSVVLTLERLNALYCAIQPQLGDIIVELLKTFMAALRSPNTVATAAIQSPVHLTCSRWPMASLPSAVQEANAQREHRLTIHAVVSLLLLWMQGCKCGHFLQFESLCQCLLEKNGVMLLLRYLGAPEIEKSFAERQDLESWRFTQYMGQGGMDTLAFIPTDVSTHFQSNTIYLAQQLWSLVLVMRLLYQIAKEKPFRGPALIAGKCVISLKKVLALEQAQVQRAALKIMRVVLPQLGRKWRNNNMAVSSAMFFYLRPLLEFDPPGALLATSPDVIAITDAESQLRQLITRYHELLLSPRDPYLLRAYPASDTRLTPEAVQEVSRLVSSSTLDSDWCQREWRKWLQDSVHKT